MSEKPNVICFPLHPTSWPTMYAIAVRLKERGEFDPVMVLNNDNLMRHIPSCIEKGISVFSLGQLPAVPAGVDLENAAGPCEGRSKSTPVKGKGRFPAFLNSSIRNAYRSAEKFFCFVELKTSGRVMESSIYNIIRALFLIVFYKLYSRKINTLLNTVKPVAAFFYTDNQGGMMGYLAKQCQQRKIRVIIPPSAFQHPDIPAKRRAQHRFLGCDLKRSPWINYLIRRYLPDQYHTYENRELLFNVPYAVLAMHFCGFLPPSPWVRGKNFCDAVCVEDFYQRDYLVGQGVGADKIAVTGHIEFDDLWRVAKERSRESFFQEKGFPAEKKLIIISLPQLIYEGEVPTWERHWEETELLVCAAVATGHNVLLVLHPKMDAQDYVFLEKKYRCRVHIGRTSEALPFGDIYINAGSSTTFWAVVCGVVTVNINDFYGYHINYFSYLRSVITIRRREDLGEMLLKLTGDEAYFKGCRERVVEDYKRFFPPLDGEANKRIISLISA